MTRNGKELTYIRAGVQSASSVQLVIVLYDLLIGALMGAISAINENDIEGRSRELKRAFLILGHLEGSLDMESGGEAARNLARFYATLRSNIINAHARASREALERQIQLLLQVRGAWAEVDNKAPADASSASPSGEDLETDNKYVIANWTA
jgi:flagellar protein FliS